MSSKVMPHHADDASLVTLLRVLVASGTVVLAVGRAVRGVCWRLDGARGTQETVTVGKWVEASRQDESQKSA